MRAREKLREKDKRVRAFGYLVFVDGITNFELFQRLVFFFRFQAVRPGIITSTTEKQLITM